MEEYQWPFFMRGVLGNTIRTHGQSKLFGLSVHPDWWLEDRLTQETKRPFQICFFFKLRQEELKKL